MTSIDRWPACYLALLREETGNEQRYGAPIRRSSYSYLDHPADSAGATMCGVTHGEYDDWRRLHGLATRPVREIEDAEIEAIFKSQYWDHLPNADLPAGLDMAVFDFAVNSGPGTAIGKLQAVVGSRIDHHFGARTKAAVLDAWAADPAGLIRRYMEARRSYGRSLGNYRSFRKNWEERWMRIESRSLAQLEPPAAAPGIRARIDGPASKAVPVLDWGDTVIVPAPKAREDAPMSMAQSDTGNAAVLTGGGGATVAGMKAAGVASGMMKSGSFTLSLFLLELAQMPEFWLGVTTVAGAAFIWFERKRKMVLHT